MGIIERYIIKQTLGAFILCLAALSAIVWLTQALREFDLLTAKGQTVFLFLRFTLLLLPSLVMVIAPIALFIACVYTLNRLNSDSELVIFSASGASRGLLLKPFAALGAALMVVMFAMSLYFIPHSFREMRNIITYVRADLLTTIIQPGKFTEIDDGLTFHIRERRPDGTLEGLMMHDRRVADETFTYLAREGLVTETDKGTYLVMQDGVIQRDNPTTGQTIVAFDRYVFDLSQFSRQVTTQLYKPREKTTSELIWPVADDHYTLNEPQRLRAELYERLSAPLYSLTFVFVALATLGYARSNRQKKSFAIILAIVLVVLIRGLGFALTNLAMKFNLAAPLLFILPLGSAGFFAWLALGKGETVSRLGEGYERLAQSIIQPIAARLGGTKTSRT